MYPPVAAKGNLGYSCTSLNDILTWTENEPSIYYGMVRHNYQYHPETLIWIETCHLSLIGKEYLEVSRHGMIEC